MGLGDLAKSYYQEQLNLALKNKNMPQAFTAHSSIGLLLLNKAEEAVVELIRRERVSEAGIEFYKGHKVLDSYDALIEAGLLSSTRRKELNRLKLQALVNDGRLCLIEEKYDAALTKFQIALDGVREIKEVRMQFEVLGLMGQAFTGNKETSLAIEQCFDLQLSLAKELGSPEFESEALLNLGIAYRDLRDFNLAIKTFYLYKDHLKTQIDDAARLEEADLQIQKTFELRDVASKIGAIESKLQNAKNPGKSFLKLARYCRKLGAQKDALFYARRSVEEMCDNVETLQIVTELCIDQSLGEDAVYFSKKLLTILENDPEPNSTDIIDALLLLSNAYCLLPTLPAESLRVLQRALELSRSKKNHPREYDILSKLAFAYQRLGLDSQYISSKEECISLWNSSHSSQDACKEAQIVAELQELDYFVNRKPSKNVMKFMDGQFNMQSRARGTKGLEIKRTRRRREGPTAGSSSTAVIRKKRQSYHIISDDDKEMQKFIVDDEQGSVPPPKAPTSKMPISEPPLYDDPPVAELVWPSSPQKFDDQGSVSGLARHSPQKSKRTWSGDPNALIASILRVTVIVFDDALMIPVIDDVTERKTITWLINEAAERYKADWDGREPIIDALMTEEGVRLCGSDPVAIVLTDGQRVRARVSGIKSQSISQIYTTMCAEYNLEVDPAIQSLLPTVKSSVIDTSRWAHDAPHLDIVVRSLIRYNEACKLTELKLNQNHMLNDGIFSELKTCRDLQVLDVSFTAITSVSWIPDAFPMLESLNLRFCNILDVPQFIRCLVRCESRIKSINLSGVSLVGVDLGDLHYLSHLETLVLSYCPMDGITGMGIMELVRKTASLKSLHLAGCMAGHYLEEMFKALEFNVTLQELSLIRNQIPSNAREVLYSSIAKNSRKSLQKLYIESD